MGGEGRREGGEKRGDAGEVEAAERRGRRRGCVGVEGVAAAAAGWGRG